MNKLFEILHKNSFLKNNKVQIKPLANIKFSKLLDIINEICLETIPSKEIRNQSLFKNTASISLSGGRGECFELNCRLNKADQLARFVTLLSDRVYTYNFLFDFSTLHDNSDYEDTDEFRIRIFEDITILSYLRPLIEKNLVIPFTPVYGYCPKCLKNSVFGKSKQKKLSKVGTALENSFLQNSSISIRKSYDENYYALILSSDELMEHGESGILLKEIILKDILSKSSSKFRKVINGDEIHLNKREMSSFANFYSEEILNNLTYQISVSEVLNTSFLTHREIDSKILQKIDNKDHLNKISPSDLEVMIPFINNIPINNILKLRDREKDSFILFRNSIKKASEEVYKNRSSSKEIAHEIRDDVIMPELARLKSTVTEAKKDLIKKPLISALSIGSVLSFGYYAGLLNNIESAAGALGFGKVLYDSVKSGIESLDTQKEIRKDKLYFLWKLHDMSKPRIGKDIIL